MRRPCLLIFVLFLSSAFPINVNCLSELIEKNGYNSSKSFANDNSNPLFDKSNRKKIFAGKDVDKIIEFADQNFDSSDAHYALYDFLFEMFAGKIPGFTFSEKLASKTPGKLGTYSNLFIRMGMLLGAKLRESNKNANEIICKRLEALYGKQKSDLKEENIKKHLYNVYHAIRVGLQVVLEPINLEKIPNSYTREEEKTFSNLFSEYEQVPLFKDLSKFTVEGKKT